MAHRGQVRRIDKITPFKSGTKLSALCVYFKYTADADDKNAFDIEAFLAARLKLKPNEVCDVYEVDTKGA